MKCSDKCPMEKLRALGKACQFKDMKDEANSCKAPDVLAFVASESARQEREAREKAEIIKREVEYTERPEVVSIGGETVELTDEQEVSAHTAPHIVRADNG